MKKLIVSAAVIVSTFAIAFAAAYADCETECHPEQSCANLLECKMAEVDCRQSCRQRQVLESLAEALERITLSLNSASVSALDETEILTQPVSVPSDEATKQRKKPFTQIDNR